MLSGLIILFRDIINFLNHNIKINNSFNFSITLGAATGILSLLIHGFTDFNFYIPANALYFVTLIGIIYGINSKKEDRKLKSSDLAKN